jgi:seryl-tRNA synthetase
MYVFSEPDGSRAEQDRMVALEEELLQALGLPYRAVDVAAGDLGASAVRKIDLEAWFPSQGRYREVTSCSNTTDFQARRLGIRWRSPQGLVPPHTLNGTVVTDRFVLALLETFQGGVPEPLLGYGAPPRIGG